MDRNDMYPIHTGFLTKSPPETRVTGNFKRWMKRWFVLWEDKTLQYFKDRGDDRPKKTIDLSRCEFLDTNLSDKKYKNIFSIRIQSRSDRDSGRTYYLSADSPYEMQTWIEKICNLCDFKAAENNNNNSDTTIRHQAPLDNVVTPLHVKEKRDSGIDNEILIVPDSDTSSDQVPVTVVNHEAQSAYDEVPPPRPKNENYDVPPHHDNYNLHPFQSPGKLHVAQRKSCPLDTSSLNKSLSDSSLSSGKRSSAGSDVYQNCDISFSQPTYDYPSQNSSRSSLPTYDSPPNQPTYDVPPSQSTYDVPPTQPTYDVPPSQPTYDVLPTYSNSRVPDRYSDGSGSDKDVDIYDIPPSTYSTYDTLPAPVSVSQTNTLPGKAYHNTTQQYGNYNTMSSRPGLQFTEYNTLPSSRDEQPTYDILPSRFETSYTPDSNYDIVPPPKPVHGDNTDGHEYPPPVSRQVKPQIKTYVNLNLPFNQFEYKKPLPSTPEMQRDSGTVLDDEDVYDVPPVPVLSGHMAPSIDRSNKPEMLVAPKVDRRSKPGVKGRDYVNLGPIRSATVKESSKQLSRGNVQRSKSAAADFESEGYLYMESPKRTDSSTRYSKKDRPIIPEEEDGETYELMSPKKDAYNSTYMNTETPIQTTEKKEASPERTTALRGTYQEISVVCQRDAPCVPQRAPKTQYTTIDLEKTEGFRKTCEDVGKGQ